MGIILAYTPGIHHPLIHSDMPSSTDAFSLEAHKITVTNLVRNATPSRLVEDALQYEGSMGTMLADSGALVVSSGKKTGRSPKDKRIVTHCSTGVRAEMAYTVLKQAGFANVAFLNAPVDFFGGKATIGED